MGIYSLHKLLFDIRSRATARETFLTDPEALYQHYALSEAELAALRAKDIYRLHKMGVAAYLLAPFAQMLGIPLTELANVLRAGAAAERPRPSS